MADEFQTGICGGNWWINSSRNSLATLPCTTTALNDIGSFGWATTDTNMVDMKVARSCDIDHQSASVSDSSIVFQDVHKPQQPHDSANGDGSVLMDSTLQMMGYGLSSSASSDWNQTLLRGSGKVESNYHSMLQDDMSSRLNYKQEQGMEGPQIQKDWSPKDFSGGSGGEDSSINTFKPMNQGFSLDQQRSNSVSSAGDCTVTCQGLPTSFPMGSAASYGYPATLLQSLFEPEPQPQQPLFENRSMNYQSTGNYRTNSNEYMPSWPKFSPFLKPSLLTKQQPTSHLHFSNNTPYWNASAAAVNDIRTSFLSSSQSQFLSPTFEEKPNCGNLTAKPNSEEVRDSGPAVKKSSSEPAFKRPRIETPSPLPTFKVRKEKLGDRITALQQLVAPFGKTDTASVLHEAIEYIKFLHDQVSVLSTPYMKNGAPIQHQQNADKLKDPEGPKQDLRSRGLCLVPISSTYPVANETTADFWTPTFGGTYR